MSDNELENDDTLESADEDTDDGDDVEGFMDLNPFPKPITPVLKPTGPTGPGNPSGTVKPTDGTGGKEQPFSPTPRPA